MLKALCFASLTALALAAGGCKDMTKDAEALAVRACACKDKVCADQVVNDLVELLRNSKHATTDEDHIRVAGQKIGTCVVAAGADPQELLEKLKPFTE